MTTPIPVPTTPLRALRTLALAGGAFAAAVLPAGAAAHKQAKPHGGVTVTPAPAGKHPRPAAKTKDDRLLTFDTCARVIEGDLIEGKKVGLIRLIGVMAPAKGEKGWHEAIDFTRKLAIGKQIKLDICPERPNDTQQRVRAVVYLPDGTNLNTKLLRAGWATVLDRKPCHIDANEWKSYEESAKEAKLGVWAPAQSEKPAAKQHASHKPGAPARPRIRRRY